MNCPSPRFLSHPRLAAIGVVLALFAGFAHWGALRAAFYMDDFLHILLNPQVIESPTFPSIFKSRSFTYWLWHCLRETFGTAPLPYHALNVGLHMATTLVAFDVFRQLSERSGKHSESLSTAVAILGCVLFASHPLGSEALCYASQTSILLVTLFSMIAADAFLRASKADQRVTRSLWLGVMALCVPLAAHAKEPGSLHLLINVFFIACLTVDWKDLWARSHRDDRLRVWLGVGFTLIILITVWFNQVLQLFSEPRLLLEHALTQARVFGEYLRLALVPIGLCSDHRIPWTVSISDFDSALKLLLVISSFTASLYFALVRARWVAVILCLAMAPLVLRFGYVVDEPMVEYRTYPSLPWLSLLIAHGVVRFSTRLFHDPRPAIVSAALLSIITYTGLTWSRERVWAREEALVRDVVHRYPLNLRALGIHLKHLMLDGQADIALMIDNLPRQILSALEDFNERDPHRAYSLGRAHLDYTSCEYYLIRAHLIVGQFDEARARSETFLEDLTAKRLLGNDDSLFLAFLSKGLCARWADDEPQLEQIRQQAEEHLPDMGALDEALDRDFTLSKKEREDYLARVALNQ